MPRDLPARPSLEHLRKQAKSLLDDLHHDDPDAVAQLRAEFPDRAPADAQLAQAQHLVARDYGFASWPKLVAHVEALEDPVLALVAALREQRNDRVRELLGRRTELRARLDAAIPGDNFGGTPLIAAVNARNREGVEMLLAHGANIDQRSHWWAGSFGAIDHAGELAPFLIERGARVDAYAAARHGLLDHLRELVAADPNCVNLRGGDGQTPLHVASTVAVAEFLLDHGAQIDMLDVDHESTPAQYLIRDHQDVVRRLVDRGARTDLLMCAALGDLDGVRRHLEVDPARIAMAVNPTWFPMRNPHAGGCIYIWTLGQGKTAHVVAREFGHEDVFRFLMERTPPMLELSIACELGDEAAFRRLLDARPDIARTLTAAEQRKLSDAARANNTVAVRLMLEAGWPVDARGDLGGTALHYAAWNGNVVMAREVLRHRPTLELKDTTYGGTPLAWAFHGSLNTWHQGGDHAGVVESLLDAGAQPPPSGWEGTAAVREVIRRRAKG